MRRPLSTRTKRLVELAVGRSVFVSGNRPDGSLQVVRRHYPERLFAQEEREGGFLMTRLPDRTR